MRGGLERLTARAHRATGALLLLVASSGLVSPTPLRAQADTAAVARVSGLVRDVRTGQPLEGATVVMVPGEGTVGNGRIRVTDAAGTFAISDVPPGDWAIRVSLPGYQTVADTLPFRAGEAPTLAIVLTPLPIIPLAPIDVSVDPALGPLVGFERRRLAHRGTFFDREDIETSGVDQFTDLVRTVPGVRIVPLGRFRSGVVFRSGCEPEVWLDGAHVGSTRDLDDVIKPHATEAIEIYRGPDLPSEFGSTLCGAIVAWTRRGDPHVEKKSLTRQFITAGAILLGFLLIHR